MLHKYLLDLHEWELISQLSKVLRVHCTLLLVNQISDTCSHCQMLKNMTQEFSVTLEALLHQVIPAMHRVNDLFDGYLKQDKSVQCLDPALCTGLVLAQQVIQQYVSKTKETHAYMIAMGM